jgi:uncharacterized membrane protein
MTRAAGRRPLRYRGFGPKSSRASLIVALVLATFAIYTAFVVVRSITAAPPPHGHNRFWVPALVLLTLLALWAVYGARRSWRAWRDSRSASPEASGSPEGSRRDR